MQDIGEALWETGLDIARALRERGYEAYLVGGCVRDRLLGEPLHDIDIASSAKPEEVMSVFPRTVPTGLRHGTVTVLREGRAFEVTTFRTEEGYSDARRPDRVTFVADLREDLARRDFTINAMAVGDGEELIDPFGGKEDLGSGRIRCVGDAKERFGEDALRMLRAIRFAARFGFRLNLSVWKAIRSQAGRLRLVAMERVGAEWEKMMAGSDPDRACGLLVRSGLLLRTAEPLPIALTSDDPAVCRPGFRPLGTIADPDVRWIAHMAGRGAKPEDVSRLSRALRFSGKKERRLVAGVAFSDRMGETQDLPAFVTAVLELGRPAAEDWLSARMERQPFTGCLEELPVDSVGRLAVKGDELARHLGRAPGPWVADMLRQLLEAAAFGTVANEKDALLAAARDNMAKMNEGGRP